MSKLTRFITLVLMLSLILGLGLSAHAAGDYLMDGGSCVVEKIHVAQRIDPVKLREVMGSTAEGEVFVSGKTTFKGDVGKGLLSCSRSGVTYELIQIEDSGDAASTVKVNVSAFRDARGTDVTHAVRIFIDALGEVVDKDTAQQLMQDIQNTDSSVSTVMLPLLFDATKADLYTAYKLTSPFLQVLNVVLGVVAVGLLLLVMFSTGLDMAYIGVPAIRVRSMGNNGNGGDQAQRPWGVSYEAWSAVQACEAGSTQQGGQGGAYHSVWFMYFRRRALSLILIAICLVYLIGGGLSGIIALVLRLTSGFQM